MLIDTHCHINMMIKKQFDTPITPDQFPHAQRIIDEATRDNIKYIINVGTSLIESKNCVLLAQKFSACYASIGIHPNDCTETWRHDFAQLKKLLEKKEEHKIIAIGECGFDKHYPGYDIMRQRDAFKAHIELALSYDLPLIVHTREAPEETLRTLEEYFNESSLRGVVHCFSESQEFADEVTQHNFVIGIGGPLTYPPNDSLREIITTIALEKIILETDAPFLPPQIIRGKENHPKHIATIANFIATLRNQSFEEIAQKTTANARKLFALPS